MHLSRLSTGHYSLECAEEDLGGVRTALRELCGTPRVVNYGPFITYTFEVAEFIFQNEWDAPCLISSSDLGDRILEQVTGILARDPNFERNHVRFFRRTD